MVYTSLSNLLSLYKSTLMLIGQGTPQIDSPSLVITFSLASLCSHWQSKEHYVVAHSSIKEEYHALTNITYELLWLCCLLKDLGVTTSFTNSIYYDNLNAI